LNLPAAPPTYQAKGDVPMESAMKMLLAATALALTAGLALPPVPQARAESTSKQQVTKKKAKAAKQVRRSPYSTNPAHDVYVNGVYVGSDPDPRVRWTIKREYCQDQVDGCMDAALR
jgi:hypothetical protein